MQWHGIQKILDTLRSSTYPTASMSSSLSPEMLERGVLCLSRSRVFSEGGRSLSSVGRRFPGGALRELQLLSVRGGITIMAAKKKAAKKTAKKAAKKTAKKKK